MNPLIIDTVRHLYLKHRGLNHRLIEQEMHALGCTRFSRRRLYNQITPKGIRPGWIEKFGWKQLLNQPEPANPTGGETTDSTTGGNTTGRECVPTPINGHASTQQTTEPTRSPEQSTDHPASEPSQRLRVSAVSADDNPPTANSQPPTDFQSWLKQISPAMHWDWPYQQLIYAQLQKVTTGECKRLMIFLPPRHGKSELVTARYTAWRLQHDPSLNVILGSYNQRLANRFSRKVRITWEDALLMQNAEDRSVPPASTSGAFSTESHASKTQMADSPQLTTSLPASPSPRLSVSAVHPTSRTRLNTVAEWETGLGGGVRAVGVGGGITGFGARLVIIDDPIKSRAEAESKTYRERVWQWFNDDLYTRLEPDAAIILIQTRWHQDDLAGRLLQEMTDGGEPWEVFSLPALAESAEPPRVSSPTVREGAADPYRSHPSPDVVVPTAVEHPDLVVTNEANAVADTLTGSSSPRLCVSAVQPNPDPLGRQPGEALCPDRFTADDLHRIRRRLGSYSFSALYQQQPTPPEGGLFKRAWFTRVVDRPPEHLRWCRGYDLAVSTKESADYTASFRCALDKATGDLYIADGLRKRMEFPEQRRYIVSRITEERNTEHGIESALHGQAFIQELRREHRLFGRAFRGIKVTADKFTRALSWANLAEEGRVVLVRGPWIEAFLDEVCTFPNSTHDDQLDAVSLAVEMLHRQKHIALGF